MAKYEVQTPNEPPETGYSTVSDHRGLEPALVAARAAAESGGPGTTVMVVLFEGGEATQETWSVSYRPEAPTLVGITAQGEANLLWPVEFRVVHDPTYDEVTVDEAGTETARRTLGEIQITEEVPVDVES